MNAITAQDLLKTTNILKAHAHDTLKEALPQLTRSHDAVFVFDDTDKFVGIINPYYVIFKSSFPPDTKLENCLYHPPKITPDTTILDIAKLMLESKIYYLPVMTNSTFHGIVTINHLLQAITSANKEPLNITSSDSLITIQEEATVADTYQLMREKQVSRLPVVNKKDRLTGIVTRYDIQYALAEPKQKPRFLSRSGEKEQHTDEPITTYAKKQVVTLPENSSGTDIVQLMLEKNIGSVVLIDNNRKPVDIVSVHDILRAISSMKKTTTTDTIIDTPDHFIHGSQLEELTDKYLKKFEKRYQITRLQIHMAINKNHTGKIRDYEITAHAANHRHEWHSTDTNFDWKKAVRGALEKLEKQMKK